MENDFVVHSGDRVALAVDGPAPIAQSPWGFRPHRVYGLGLRLLKVSNAMHSDCVDGVPFAEPGTSRYANWRKP